MRRIHYWVLGGAAAAVFPGSAIVGAILGGGMLHPVVRPLSPALIQRADRALQQAGATREDFVVGAPDGVMLSGWKARPRQPNGAWVLVFHGMSDNRAGPLGQAELLLRHGYSLVMMDARAHGESGGPMATFGWMERRDTRAITDALYATETPGILVALGTSMGAAIALQSAGTEPRIAGVVAESAFRNLREVTYDYAGLKRMPWLGMTLFRPATWTALAIAEPEGGFAAEDVSPEIAVAARAFPVLLICDALDGTIPCRHSRSILEAARGPKQLWEVPGARHARALGTAPAEYERRVISFIEGLRRTNAGSSSTAR